MNREKTLKIENRQIDFKLTGKIDNSKYIQNKYHLTKIFRSLNQKIKKRKNVGKTSKILICQIDFKFTGKMDYSEHIQSI